MSGYKEGDIVCFKIDKWEARALTGGHSIRCKANQIVTPTDEDLKKPAIETACAVVCDNSVKWHDTEIVEIILKALRKAVQK